MLCMLLIFISFYSRGAIIYIHTYIRSYTNIHICTHGHRVICVYLCIHMCLLVYRHMYV